MTNLPSKLRNVAANFVTTMTDPLNVANILSKLNTTFLVGDPLNVLSSCPQLALVVGPTVTNQTYTGWANNFKSLLTVLQNTPANMKNESQSFLCLDDDSVFVASDQLCAMTKYNQTAVDSGLFSKSTQGVISNFTGSGFQLGNTNVGSPLNGVIGCNNELNIDLLRSGDNSIQTLKGAPVTDLLLNVSDPNSVLKFAITCGSFSYGPWMQGCPEHSSSHSIHVSIPLTLLLVSMSMLFVNGLFV